MFGWEFPPHISGGLGTACYGLTKELARLKNIELLFVVPKSFGDEDQSLVKLIGANNIPVARKEVILGKEEKIEMLEVQSEIIPYVTEKEFWNLKKKNHPARARFVRTEKELKINFTGGYGPGLIDEIKNYALVAEIIAHENNFDLIHAHDWLAYPAGIAAKNFSNKPLVIHVHATEFDRSGDNVNPVVYSIEREGMETADKIIAVSNFTRQTIIDKYGITPGKIETVYNAVEPLTDKQKIKLKKGFREKVVCFLGRITMQKGPEYFIEAAYLVLRKMNNVRFVMAGSGDKMNEMIARVAHLGIADKFHFTGFLKGINVYHMLQMSDVIVMPSVSEPFGIVPLEAIQAGIPVIISNQSGVSEILSNAVKIDFWDTFAIADAIYGLLNYPALSTYLKKSGKHEADSFRWNLAANHVQEIYKSLLKN